MFLYKVLHSTFQTHRVMQQVAFTCDEGRLQFFTLAFLKPTRVQFTARLQACQLRREVHVLNLSALLSAFIHI